MEPEETDTALGKIKTPQRCPQISNIQERWLLDQEISGMGGPKSASWENRR